jgi:hypothetical protein
MKLDFAAPDNFFPSLATACVAQVSRLHFCMKLILAAPASGLPFFPTALLSQVSCAVADPTANVANSTASNNLFIVVPPLKPALRHLLGDENLCSGVE